MYERYAELRDSMGVTDYKVAQACGFGRATLSEWKAGTYTPKHDKLQKIAAFFNVSVDYLTGEISEKVSTEGTSYYFDDETAAKAQELFDNPDLRMLFDAARDSRPEDLQMAADMLKRFKETNPNG